MATDAYRLTEVERKAANTVWKGKVVEADAANARVRVAAGGRKSGWLRFAVSRAGGDRTWSCPDIGEQVMVLCPSGNPAQGVVVGALYADESPAPGNTPDQAITVYKDGARLTYDRAAHAWTLDVPAGGTAVLKVGGASLTVSDSGVAIVGDVTVTGSINASGSIVDAGGNTNHHSH